MPPTTHTHTQRGHPDPVSHSRAGAEGSAPFTRALSVSSAKGGLCDLGKVVISPEPLFPNLHPPATPAWSRFKINVSVKSF